MAPHESTALMPLSPRALNSLKTAFLFALGGHLLHPPFWPPLAAILLVVWRHRADRRGAGLPVPATRLLIAGAACTAVYVQFGFFMGRDPGVAALVVLAAIKLLELRNHRDFHLMGYLIYFLIAAQFLFHQDLPVLFLSVLQLLAVNAAFFQLYARGEQNARPWKGAAGLLAVSIPAAAVLFVLFPRLPGPLWGLGGRAGDTGVSGFSDVLQPGMVARMVQSDRPVFRVRFENDAVPPARERYFRGLVLWLTDGRAWYPGRFREAIAGSRGARDQGIRQEIDLEPHGTRWMFALDYPVRVPPGSRLVPGEIFMYHRRLERLTRYRVRSRTGGMIPAAELHPLLRRLGLQLPRQVDPRLRRLATEWCAGGGGVPERVRRALDYFRTRGFVYTLNPGTLDPADPMADFLLTKRRGFCGHYAAAFSLMMRLCGVPARVVAGYQGGTVNPVDGRLVVRDSDAHAWSEVWVEGRGWLRVDPVAAVVPERLEYGGRLNASLDRMDAAGGEDRSAALRRALAENWLTRIWRRIRDYWDVARNYWQTWVVRYDRFQQRSLLMRLGARGVRGAGLMILVLAVLVLSWRLARWIFRRPYRGRRDPLTEGWRLLESRLVRGGLAVEAWEGPMAVARNARLRFPAQAAGIDGVVADYIRFRYLRPPTAPQLREWRGRIRRLHFKSRSAT